MLEGGESTYQLLRAAGLGVALALVLVLEHWRPHTTLRPAWGTNAGLWAIDAVVTTAVCGACAWLVAGWAARHGIGLLPWLGTAGMAAAAVSVVALDGVSYAWHRLNHRLALLWRFHGVHHSDTSFHVTTGLRFHPGELLLALPVRLAAVVALGAPPEGILLFELLFGMANLFEHGNFDLPRRIEPAAQWLLITPALHRAHHAADWQELDTNFGTILSGWDRLAGTLRPSDASRRVVTGLPDRRRAGPPSLSESLWAPFAFPARRPR